MWDLKELAKICQNLATGSRYLLRSSLLLTTTDTLGNNVWGIFRMVLLPEDGHNDTKQIFVLSTHRGSEEAQSTLSATLWTESEDHI